MIMIMMTNIYTFNDMKKFYGEHLDLMCKKGIYPYAWVGGFDKMDYVGETYQLSR